MPDPGVRDAAVNTPKPPARRRPGARTYYTPPPDVVAQYPGSTGAHPRGGRPPAAQAPPGSVTVTQVGGMPGYITVNDASFTNFMNQSATMTAEEAWTNFIAGTGLENLDLPHGMNWYPGIMIPNYDQILAAPGIHSLAPAAWLDPMKRQPWEDTPFKGNLFENEDTGEKVRRYYRYDPSAAARQFYAMGANERSKYTKLMAEAGLLPEEWSGIGDFDPEAAGAFQQALSWANYWGKPVDEVLASQAALRKKLGRDGGGGGGGGAGPQVKIEVPNYETMAQLSKELIKGELNRDVEDWEMNLVADEMKRQYGAWASATRARMVGGNGTYEIPDPQVLTRKFFEDTYANEIERLDDVEDTRLTNNLLLQASTLGGDMVAGGA